MEKIITVDGKAVRLRATASVPRLYRMKFGRDIIRDIGELAKAYKSVTSPGMSEEEMEEARFSVTDLTVFENVAYIMARHGDPDGVPADVGEWLDQFETFSIYQVLPEVLELWGLNERTTAESKKKFGQAAGK